MEQSVPSINENKPQEIFPYVMALCGGATFFLGIVVLGGWLYYASGLLPNLLRWLPVDSCTALGLTLSGISLLCVALDRKRPALVLGLVVLLLSGWLLMQFFLGAGTSKIIVSACLFYCGRMSGVVALLFAFLSIALVSICISKRGRFSHWLLGIPCAWVGAVGVNGIIDYVTGSGQASEYAHLTSISPFVSAGCLPIVAGILCFLWNDMIVERKSPARWLAVVFFSGALTVALLQCNRLATIEKQTQQKEITSAVSHTAKFLTSQMESRMDALVRMAERLARQEYTQEGWESDARLYVQHYPGYQAIALADPSLHVSWMVPVARNRADQDRSLYFEAHREGVLAEAQRRHEVVFTHAESLATGAKGFLAVAPIFDGKEFKGFILGVFRFKELFDSILKEEVLSGQDVSIFEGEKEIYARAERGVRADGPVGQDTTVHLYGVDWRVQIRPQPGGQAVSQPAISHVALILGLMISFSLGILVYFSETVRQRTQTIAVINRDLVSDIAAREEAEEQLRKVLADLMETRQELIQAEKMQVIGRLASGVAHEVKNPLAIILQGVEYLAQRVPADENITMVIKAVKDAVARADGIVRGLLEFSSISQLDMGLVNLNSVIEKSLLLVKHQSDRQHVRMVLDLAQDLPSISLCQNRIEQVFVNIFMNAMQAMGGSGTITVKTTVREVTVEDKKDLMLKEEDVFAVHSSVVVAEVTDSGPGIPPGILDKIFDPFFTTKRDKGGTGLGLYIVKSIMDTHSARIKIANLEEGGVKITLMFKG